MRKLILLPGILLAAVLLSSSATHACLSAAEREYLVGELYRLGECEYRYSPHYGFACTNLHLRGVRETLRMHGPKVDQLRAPLAQAFTWEEKPGKCEATLPRSLWQWVRGVRPPPIRTYERHCTERAIRDVYRLLARHADCQA
jgi:hypothetical protein